ncbi:hypothetical protein KY285_010256 [Solanum tuberosum]|nr:hypothetical protein KY289_010793 [Solanum tuberosum]KAH0734549.1 hypothetical protein KY285_010256 [Solanum tuberosum]
MQGYARLHIHIYKSLTPTKQQNLHLKCSSPILLLQPAKKDLTGGSGVNIERLNLEGHHHSFLKSGGSELPMHSVTRPPTEKQTTIVSYPIRDKIRQKQTTNINYALRTHLKKTSYLTENNIITLITQNMSMRRLKFVQGGNIFSGKFECERRRGGEEKE